MDAAWKTMAFIILGFVFLNNAAKNYYDMMTSEKPASRLPWFFIKAFVPPVVYMLLVIDVYFLHNDFTKTISLNVLSADNLDLSSTNTMYESLAPATNAAYTASVSFFESVLVPLVLIAKLAFSIFGGTGMALLPLRLIEVFYNRPEAPVPFEHILAKKVLNDTSEGLIDIGKQALDLKRDIDMLADEDDKEREMKLKILREKVYELKVEFIEFEQFYEAYEETDNILESNPLVYWSCLVLGILSCILSLIVIIHTILTISGIYGFLEWLFVAIDGYNIMFSVLLFLIVVIYLTAALTYGSAKITYILTWLLNTHPVRPGKTWTDTFLLNTTIIMLSTLGMLVFLTDYCRNYLRFLEADTLFNKMLSRTPLIYFLKKRAAFQYLMILFFLMSVFISFFLQSGPMIMKEKIEEKKLEVDKEKQRLSDLESKNQKVHLG